MKKLSKFEMAAVKRTAQNVKGMRKRKAKLEEKQSELTKEINELDEMISDWEIPILKLTDGFTSEQVLNGEMEESEIIADSFQEQSDLDDSFIPDDSPLDETEVKSTDDQFPFAQGFNIPEVNNN